MELLYLNEENHSSCWIFNFIWTHTSHLTKMSSPPFVTVTVLDHGPTQSIVILSLRRLVVCIDCIDSLLRWKFPRKEHVDKWSSLCVLQRWLAKEFDYHREAFTITHDVARTVVGISFPSANQEILVKPEPRLSKLSSREGRLLRRSAVYMSRSRLRSSRKIPKIN